MLICSDKKSLHHSRRKICLLCKVRIIVSGLDWDWPILGPYHHLVCNDGLPLDATQRVRSVC